MNTQPQVSMGSLRLFTSPSAFPNPQRLRIFLHEKGIADQFNERIYDMTPVGEQRQWRHLKMNPWGETPTLELRGTSPEQQSRQYVPSRMRNPSGSSPRFMSSIRGWGRSSNSPPITPGASIAAKRRWPTPPSSTSICRTAASGCSAATNRPFRTSPWRPRSPSPSSRSTQPPLDERFEHIDAFWQRWQRRPTFLAAYADRSSGVPELDNRP